MTIDQVKEFLTGDEFHIYSMGLLHRMNKSAISMATYKKIQAVNDKVDAEAMRLKNQVDKMLFNTQLQNAKKQSAKNHFRNFRNR